MTTIQVIAKESHDVIANFSMANIKYKLNEPSVVLIEANLKDVAEIKRDGSNAIVVLKNGDKIVIENFFDNNDNTNSLVFKDSQDKLIWAQFSDAAAAQQGVTYGYIQSVEPLLYHDAAAAPLLYGLGVAGLVGGGIALLMDDDHNSTPASTPSPVVTQNNASGLAGTAKAGDTVLITLPNGSTISTVADASGNWSIPQNPLQPGQTAEVVARAPDGTVSTPTDTTRATEVPTAPTTAPVVTDDAAPILGNVANNAPTNDVRPALSGTGTAGQIITVYDKGVAIGSTTVQPNGTWSFTPSSDLPQGDHTFTYTARIGTGVESAASPSIKITIDSIAPLQPANAATITDDATPIIGTVANGASTNDQRPTISGSGTPGETITVYDGTTPIGTTTVAPNGSWSFTPTGNLIEGAHTFKYTTTDPAGNVSPDSPPITVVVDTTKPTTPAVAATVTDDQSPILGNVLDNQPTNDNKPTFSGTGAEPNAVVTIYDDGQPIGSITVAADGTWSFTPTTALGDGTHPIQFDLTDPAGNTSIKSPIINVVVDTTPPTANIAITGISDDTGTAGDFITSDNTLSVNGTVTGLQAGEKLQISLDAGATWTDLVVNAGQWVYNDSRTLANGNYNYSVRAIDAAGNAATPVNQTVTVDTNAPTAAVTITSVSTDSGSSSSDFITNDTSLTVNGNVSGLQGSDKLQISLDNGANWIDVAVTGNTFSYVDSRTLTQGQTTYQVRVINAQAVVGATDSQVVTIDTTAPNLPTVSIAEGPTINLAESTSDGGVPVLVSLPNNAAIGDVITVSIDGSTPIAYTVTANDVANPTTPIQIVLPTAAINAAGQGQAVVTTTYTDAAGNSAAPVLSNLTIDTIAPNTPAAPTAYTDNVGSIQNLSSTAPTTDDTTPGLRITSGLTDQPSLYVDGQKVAASYDSATGTLTPDLPLSAGPHALTYTLTDAAGNESSPSAPFNLTIDQTAPTAAIAVTGISDDTGVAGDFITSDTQISVNGTVGTLASDEKLQISTDNGTTWTDLSVNAGNWTYVDPRTLSNGVQTYQLRTIDAAGNAGAVVSKNVTIDTNAPTASIAITSISDDTGSSATDFITKDTSLNINGTVSGLQSGDKAQISINGTTWTDLTVSNGTFTFADARVLTQGDFNYQVRVINSNAVVGATASKTVTVDLTAPTNPTTTPTINDDVGAKVGLLNNGDVTDDTQPTITGTGVKDDIITIFDNTVAIGSTVVKPDGTWSFTPTTPLTDGSHPLSYAATDVAGNSSIPSPIKTIIVDTAAPVANINITSISDDTGIAGDFITGDTQITVNGTVNGLASGERLQISVDGGANWIELPVSNGTWSYADPRTLANQTYTYAVRAIDTAGNAAAPVTRQVTIDTAAPTATLSIDSISDDTGASATDFITRDNTLTVTGTVNGLLPNQKVQISTNGGTTWTDVTTTNGTWNFIDQRSLADGQYTYTVRATNSAETAVGNVISQKVTVDQTAPTGLTAPTVTDDATPITGSIANQGVTNDTTPTISGTGAPNDVIAILDNGSVIGSTTVLPNGTWSFTPSSPLGQGSHQFAYTETDPAGNTSLSSPITQVTIDSVAPSPSIVINSISDDTGVAGDFITSDQTLTVNGSVNGLAAGESLQISIDGGVTWNALPVNAGAWSYVDGRTLTSGNYTYQVRAIDTAGNTSTPVSQLVKVDTSAPSGSIAITSISDDTGASSSDFITNDQSLTVNGTVSGLTNGDKAQISIDGGNTWTDLSVTNGTSFSYADTRTLTDGNYTYQVRIISNTNVVGATGSKLVTVDLTPPATPTTPATLTDDIAPVLGTIANGGSTNDNLPTISGSGGIENEIIKIYDNTNNLLGTAVVAGDGTWSFTPTITLSPGSHSVQYTATDKAGNESLKSPAVNFTVDTIAPTTAATVTIVSDSNNDGLLNNAEKGNATTANVNIGIPADAQAGDVITITDGNNTVLATYVVGTGAGQVAAGSTQILTANLPADGGNLTINTAIKDAAGNVGPTAADSVKVDTTAPSTAATVTIVLDSSNDGLLSSAEKGTATTTNVTVGIPANAQAGDVITITDGNNAVLATFVVGTGAGQVAAGTTQTITAPLPSDGNTLTVNSVIKDAAGNVGPTANDSIKLDTTAPTTAATVTITSDTNNDGVLNNAEKNGANTATVSVGIPANAQAGDVITITDGNNNVLATYVVGTGAGQVAAGSTQTLTATLPAEGGNLSINTAIKDAAGNVGPTAADSSYC